MKVKGIARAGAGQVTSPILVSGVRELRDFAASPAFASKRPLVLSLPQVPPGELRAMAERLNQYRLECGCSLGARAMTGGLLAATALLAALYGPLSVAFVVHLPLAFAAAVVFAVVGKVVGIVRARRRARGQVAAILARTSEGGQ
jgi:hypothetical protein